MNEQRVYVNNDNVATFMCPECGKMITMNFAKYQHTDEIVMLQHRCQCGRSSTVLVERRKHYRKAVNLPGKYILHKDKTKGTMRVKDLSRGGLKFRFEAKRKVAVGDKIFVAFRLDDTEHTVIKKDVFIRSVSGPNIGAEFCSKSTLNDVDRAYDKAITQYILYARLVESGKVKAER